jgi:hypothetical protein
VRGWQNYEAFAGAKEVPSCNKNFLKCYSLHAKFGPPTMRFMPRVTRHLRVGLVLVLLLLFNFVPLRAGAVTAPPLTGATTSKVFITEVQTTGASPSEEFVEFYNNSDTDVDFADLAHAGKTPWKLQFFSAASTAAGLPDWTKPSATITMTGVIPAHDYYLLGATGYAPGGIDGDQSYNPRLSDSGGGLQLVEAGSTAITYHDRLMWKQSGDGQTLPAGVFSAPVNRGSLQRLPNDDAEYVSAEGKLSDMTGSADISPKDVWHEPLPAAVPDAPEVPAPTPADNPTEDGEIVTETPPVLPDTTGLLAPYVTELLPNPAAPLSDEADEFIELYNPNSRAFDLKGYTLEVGTTTLHEFTFTGSVPLAPLTYTAFYSVDTKLSLANSGGQARLLAPEGTKLSETLAYDAADDGVSWSLNGRGDNWLWSTTPTPDAANAVTAKAVAAKTTKAAAVKAAASKAAATKPTAKTAAAKVKGTSTTKSKTRTKTAATKKATKPKVAAVSQTKDRMTRAPIHTAVLVSVVAAAVLYAAYEYRHDISNRLHKLRRYRAVRGYARQ